MTSNSEMVNNEKKTPDDKPSGKIKFISSDNKSFLVTEEVAKQNNICIPLLDYVGNADNGIPLQNVKAKTLKQVITFCEKFASDPPYDSQKGQIDLRSDLRVINFLKNMNSQDLSDILLAADYLENKRLIDAGLHYIHRNLQGMDVDEIRKALNLEDDFTAEEKKQFEPVDRFKRRQYFHPGGIEINADDFLDHVYAPPHSPLF